MDDLVGKVVDGYVLPCVLGEGASGVVFLGKKDGALRAIKVLKQGSTDSFFAEARRQQSIVHPNVVQVYDIIHNPPAIVMEFIEGGTLEERLKNNDGSIIGNPINAINIAKDIVSGLIAIHDAGFVHRDVKPANILFNSAGVAKIGDLGVVARIDGAETASNDAAIAGTLFYRAPEQRYGVGDTRSDIYSVGRVLYKMLTGKLPSDTGTNHPMEVSDVDGFLDMVVAQSLEVDPNLRFQSAKEMFYALDKLVVLTPVKHKDPMLYSPPVRKPLAEFVNDVVASRRPTTNVGDPWVDPAEVKKKQERNADPAFGRLAYIAALIIFGSTAIFRACNFKSSVSSSSPSVPNSISRPYIEYGVNNVNERGVTSSAQNSFKSDDSAVGSIDKLLNCSDLDALQSVDSDCRGQAVIIYGVDKDKLVEAGGGIVLSKKGYVLSCDRLRSFDDLVILGKNSRLHLHSVASCSSDNIHLFRALGSVDYVVSAFDGSVNDVRGLSVSENYVDLTAFVSKEHIKNSSKLNEDFGRVIIRQDDVVSVWIDPFDKQKILNNLMGVLPGTPIFNKSGAFCGLLYESSFGGQYNFIPAPKLVAFIDALRE